MAAVLKTSIQRLLTLLVGMVVLTDATDAVELLSWMVPVVEVDQQGDYPGSRQLLPRALDDSLNKRCQDEVVAVPDFQYTALAQHRPLIPEGRPCVIERERVFLLSLHFDRALYLLHCNFRC